jgi:2-polyprenyl-6-hydroxyphenyl methylase/3-demethylubiquinone-9 3-methyltransferase
MEPEDIPTPLRWRLAQWLERRWWRQYLHRRPAKDYLLRKQQYWQRVLATVDWQPQPGARALDAGCGPAGIFIALADSEVWAVDPLLHAYAQDLPHFRPADYPWVQFRAGRIESGFPEGPFDEIYCLNAINHVADWSGALDALTAASRPGTRLLLTSDVHRSGLLCRVFRALPGDALHPQQHRAAAYRRALQQRGWLIESETRLRRGRIFDYLAWVGVRQAIGLRH